jgi:hypothetical protein
MATIKSYTDIDQSRKLAEILPLESADMLFQLGEDKYADSIRVPLTKEHWKQMMPDIKPCWSLASLLEVLPTKLQIALAINDFQGDIKEKYVIGSVEHDKYDCFADNPVDACYELILKLNELNLL